MRVAAVEKSGRQTARPRNWPGGSRRHGVYTGIQFWFWLGSFERLYQTIRGGLMVKKDPEDGFYLLPPNILEVGIRVPCGQRARAGRPVGKRTGNRTDAISRHSVQGQGGKQHMQELT